MAISLDFSSTLCCPGTTSFSLFQAIHHVNRSFAKHSNLAATQRLAIAIDNLLLDDIIDRPYPFRKGPLKLPCIDPRKDPPKGSFVGIPFGNSKKAGSG